MTRGDAAQRAILEGDTHAHCFREADKEGGGKGVVLVVYVWEEGGKVLGTDSLEQTRSGRLARTQRERAIVRPELQGTLGACRQTSLGCGGRKTGSFFLWPNKVG